LYLNTPENAEVAEGAGIAFERGNLADVMRRVLDMSEAEREAWRARAMERARERYSWDAVTSAYEKLLMDLAEGGRRQDRLPHST
jgi:glycosyltransferase involved in cell wall biosynthesis